MRRARVAISAVMLAVAALCFTACDAQGITVATPEPTVPEAVAPETPEPVVPEATPSATELALCTIGELDVSRAFGGVALSALSDFSTKVYVASEEPDGTPRNAYAAGTAWGLDYALGIDADGSLFGTGGMTVAAFAERNGERVSRDFRANLYGDAETFCIETESGTREYDIADLAARVAEMAREEVLSRLYTAAAVLPDALGKGVNLRLGVEKLLDLGFTVSVDTENGTRILLRAERGFFTALLNDAFGAIFPRLASVLPRFDLEFRSTDFQIVLNFDGEGRFETFSVESDVDVGSSLALRKLITFRSGVACYGGFTLSATRA